MSPSKCFSVLPPRVAVGETGQLHGLVEFFHSHMYLCLKVSIIMSRAHMFADFVTAIFSLGHVFKVLGSL